MEDYLQLIRDALPIYLKWFRTNSAFTYKYLDKFSCAQAHLTVWYDVWVGPGADLLLVLRRASEISSLVISMKGRSSGWRNDKSVSGIPSRTGGGWNSSFRRASPFSLGVVALLCCSPRSIGGVG